jgi:hypothetical protein
MVRIIAVSVLLALALTSNAVAEEPDSVEAYNARMIDVGVKAKAVVDACEAKRKAGELKTETAFVECVNPQLLEAYIDARVLYLDLTKLWLAAKLDAAKRLDKGDIARAQYDLDLADWRLKIAAEEERRKKAAVDTAAGREPEPHTPSCYTFDSDKYCF